MQAPCACLTEALLIKATADLMRLPQAATGSALVFLHRFHTAPPQLKIPEQVSPLLRRIALTRLSHTTDRGVCWALFTCGRSEACCCMPVPGHQSRRGATPFNTSSNLRHASAQACWTGLTDAFGSTYADPDTHQRPAERRALCSTAPARSSQPRRPGPDCTARPPGAAAAGALCSACRGAVLCRQGAADT